MRILFRTDAQCFQRFPGGIIRIFSRQVRFFDNFFDGTASRPARFEWFPDHRTAPWIDTP